MCTKGCGVGMLPRVRSEGERSEPAGQHTRGDEGEKRRGGSSPQTDRLTAPNWNINIELMGDSRTNGCSGKSCDTLV